MNAATQRVDKQEDTLRERLERAAQESNAPVYPQELLDLVNKVLGRKSSSEGNGQGNVSE